MMHLLSLVSTAYQTVEITDEYIALWETMLKDVDYSIAAHNLHRHMLTSKYPPTIAEIVEDRGQMLANRRMQETKQRIELLDTWNAQAYLPEGRDQHAQ
ncbi:Loader and inhibitor of phage G40P [Paenibacillus aquistagni]|uniref:Loader and inhibitor of phage G40P n=1 Tax=Paenibacillus aquistagni TaxID=1852522 RepID=A0A1X7LWQ6_9BACL|nr:Loader and inhibitor of phage G40P [Paenibacillus aquistagni]